MKSNDSITVGFCGSDFSPDNLNRTKVRCMGRVHSFFLSLLGCLMIALPPVSALAADEDQPVTLRFAISRYVVEGATLLTPADFGAVVAPYVGQDKDFSDVQSALEAIEALYAERGYSAVHVLLPEQELEAGTVRFQVIEGHYGKVTVKNNQFFSEENVLNAVPSVRSGGVPRSKQVARELRLANENPARQINVVLKGGEQDDLVDASVLVTDSRPSAWTVTLDNSGSEDTGRSRLGLSYRDANLFDRDHVGQLQVQTSPQHTDRVKVVGGSYKIPLYENGHSVEFFGAYSNINALVGGLSNFQGGGLMFSSRYNIPLERWGTFDPRVTFGLDWRKFNKVELTNPPPTILYDEIVVTPLSVAYATQGRLWGSDVGLNASFAANVPFAGRGKSADFAAYDHVNASDPAHAYKVLRGGGNFFTQFKNDWQIRGACRGQWSGDRLIQGEQMRLGGADGVRGFSEGSESGEQGGLCNFEGYAPALQLGNGSARALLFVDGGAVYPKDANRIAVASAGLGMRASYSDSIGLRLDAGRIVNAGTDPNQLQGDWRIHASLSGTF